MGKSALDVSFYCLENLNSKIFKSLLFGHEPIFRAKPSNPRCFATYADANACEHAIHALC